MSLSPFGAALVTGASSGIGKATAGALAAAGYLTVATARDPRRLGDLEAAGCRVLALDVADQISLTSAVHTIEEVYGGVSGLVNNAGYVEGLSDTLRAEVAPFGIEVIVIEPGLVTSGFNARAHESSALAPNGGPYESLKQALRTRAFRNDAGRLERTFGATPEQVAEVVVRAIGAERPKTRYA